MRFAHWFPLIPRPRPPADSLNARVERLTTAGRTARFGSGEEALAAAAQVYNGAALLASDVGLPELARDWCWEHAHAYLTHLPLNATMAQRALEPVVNLVRLRIRAGNGTEAQEAAEQARQHGGIGDRLFDGRQVTVIAEMMSENPARALAMIEGSVAREPWEQAVQAVLALWCRRESAEITTVEAETALGRVRDVDSGRVVFTTRLGIVATELLGGLQEDSSELASRLVSTIIRVQDGYAARDLLTAWGGKLSSEQMGSLIPVLEPSGLDRQTLPGRLIQELHTVINEASRRLDDHSVLT